MGLALAADMESMSRSPQRALNLAMRAAASSDVWTALLRLREMLCTRERLGPEWATALALASRIGDDTGAMLAARRRYEETPRNSKTASVLAAALTQYGQASEGADLLCPLADAGRLTPDEIFKLTRTLMFAGRIEEAQHRARALLKTDPLSPTLWERIAQTKQFRSGDSDIDAMLAAFHRWPESRPAGQAAIAAALAKAFVDIGDDRSADKYLGVRASANRARFAFDPRSLEIGVRDIVDWCNTGVEDVPALLDRGSGRAIFILGSVRSGSSLLEQIISRHADIAGGGELKHFWLASAALGDHRATIARDYVARAHARDPNADPWGEIGRRYMALADDRFGPARRFTDKLLSNINRVRAIRHALPGAKLLSLKRRPLDIAWSCWRAQLDADAAWNTTESGIALYIASVARIMDAWTRRYPGAIIEVSYEDLVTTPEIEIPRLLTACGLSDDPATRQPELSDKAVMTLSFAQVRSPIHGGSVGGADAFPLATRKLRESLIEIGLDPT